MNLSELNDIVTSDGAYYQYRRIDGTLSTVWVFHEREPKILKDQGFLTKEDLKNIVEFMGNADGVLFITSNTYKLIYK